jgi:cation-transporting ATPase 13A3/4/5
MLDYYTHHGYRVIALATKSLKASRKRAQRMKRTEAESDLIFLGFIVFENKLKPSTAGVLAQLREARIRRIMCTGDNILTAISVARECELVGKDGYVFVPHFKDGFQCAENFVDGCR